MAITGNLLPANSESIETDASGWTALTNATGLAQASGGTLGSSCLQFKAVAAGDCQVMTAGFVDVTAGAEYWSCASVYAPAAGAQSRMEIRWYRANQTLLSTVQGPVVTATGASWNQNAVIAIAPAEAAKATVSVRVTATAAGQAWYLDRAFLGVPVTSTGNLLPFNWESMEIDTGGWFNTLNCTLSSTTTSYSWYQAARITATASGAFMARTALTGAPAVVPGEEYVAYVYVTPSAAAIPVQWRIYWRSADGTELGSASTTWTPSTGGWTRLVVIGVAPPGAAVARLSISGTASAAGQTWTIDRAVLAPTSALATAGNLLPYGTADMEQDISGWTVTGATASQSTESTLSGGYSLKLVGTGGDMVAAVATPVPVTAGVGYEFRPCSRQTAEGRYQTRIDWLDAGGDTVRSRWQTWEGRTGSWLLSSMGDLAPDGAVAARVSFVIPDAPVGSVWYLDRMGFAEGGLTAKAVPAAGGGAQITLRGLTSGGPTWKWSLWRLGTESPQPVRGWSGDLTSQPVTNDMLVVTDYEAPMGVPVQWRVRIDAPSGTVGTFTYTSDPITLDADPTAVWLKDPGLPQRSCKVTVGTPLPTWQTSARQGVSQVRGRRLPVVISDVRSGRTGSLTVVTETTAERDALNWVLESGSVLLLQWPPGWGETDMYVSVGDVSAAPVVDYAEFHDRTWVLPLTEVDRPIGGVTGSADRVWQDVADAGLTWAEALAGALSWLDVYTGSVND